MRYIINNSPLTRDKVTGIELVTQNLIDSVNLYTQNVNYLNWGKTNSKLFKVLWSLFLVNFKLNNGDIYISPDGIAPVFKRKGVRYISIVHDKIWKSNARTLEYFYYRFGTRGFGKWVYPIFVSYNTQREYNLNNSQSSVVYNVKLKQVKSLYKSKAGFLIIGPSSKRKNFYNQLVAWYNATINTSFDQSLSVIGLYNEDDLDKFLRNYPLAQDRINLLGYIPDSEKEKLLIESKYVLCASNYEGLGHPFIEAIEYGCIPIAQALPSYKELIFNSKTFPFSKSGSSKDIEGLIARLVSDYTFQNTVFDEVKNVARKWLDYNCFMEYIKCFKHIESL